MPTGEKKSTYAIYAGGLIAISVVLLQAFIPLERLDIPETISIFALAISIPLLAGFAVTLNFTQQEDFDNKMIIIFYINAFITIIGISAALYHISWIACTIFVVSVIATPAIVRYAVYERK